MALTFELDSVTESIGLDDYVEHIGARVDFSDTDSVRESAAMLKALSNDASLLVRWINTQLRDSKSLSGGGYGGFSLCLWSSKLFTVQVNFWLPPDAASPNQDYDDAYQSYGLAHDHDFSFLTVGYLGAGYSTHIYEYDPSGVVGYAGEKVDLEFSEETTLPAGKVMFYRESQDVHIQYPPDELSVSLNLRSADSSKAHHSQFLFDLDESVIHKLAESTARHPGLSVCRVAALVGDDSTVDRLEAIAQGPHSPLTRWTAIEAAIEIDAERARGSVRAQLQRESSPYVRAQIATLLDKS